MKTILSAVLVSLVTAGAYVGTRPDGDGHRTGSIAIRPAAAAFRPSPIPSEWIIAGDPVTEVAEVSRTRDETAKVYLWRTTAGTFRWVHGADEIVTILQGEVFVTDSDGQRHHLTAGDVAHFQAGADQVWEVPVGLLKSAILKDRSPQPVEAALRWMRWMRGLGNG